MKRYLIAAVATILMVSGSVAVAQTVDDGNVFHACEKDGKVIADTTRLHPDEPKCAGTGMTVVTWNEKGVQGDQGDQGIQGLKGDTGDLGPQGPEGPEGPQGIQGENGDTGEQGIQGLIGLTGSEGPIGPEGPAGGDGTQWFQGSTPAQGTFAEGDLWLRPDGYVAVTYHPSEYPEGYLYWQVRMSIRGPTGSQGLQGLQGPQGPQGGMIHIAERSCAFYFMGGCMSWEYSCSAVSGALPGDLCLDPDDDTLYQSDANGLWTFAGDLTGATGPAGPRGVQGSQGIPGENGDTGEQGLQGIPGVNGDTGEQGIQGPIGLTGPEGPVGISYYYLKQYNNLPIDAQGEVTITQSCDPGDQAVAGGWDVEADGDWGYSTSWELEGSGPNWMQFGDVFPNFQQWRFNFDRRIGRGNFTQPTFVLCADLTP
jgi:hypothetical protein